MQFCGNFNFLNATTLAVNSLNSYRRLSANLHGSIDNSSAKAAIWPKVGQTLLVSLVIMTGSSVKATQRTCVHWDISRCCEFLLVSCQTWRCKKVLHCWCHQSLWALPWDLGFCLCLYESLMFCTPQKVVLPHQLHSQLSTGLHLPSFVCLQTFPLISSGHICTLKAAFWV